jgi:hypothetical protein
MFEIHVFLANATSSSMAATGFIGGDRHALILFKRQEAETDHDFEAADEHLVSQGWKNVEVTKAGTLTPESLNGKDVDFCNAYETALDAGNSIIVYRDPIPAKA